MKESLIAAVTSTPSLEFKASLVLTIREIFLFVNNRGHPLLSCAIHFTLILCEGVKQHN